ncbi:MAG TPA: dihydroneopterin triphosphate diphosphatase [Blastocatellia bacterium]|nr:dihydroneopterin triphosphate diphosphatase [Blastocatellia bacterium]
MYKRPRSVQIVVFREALKGREYLLLKRVETEGGYWQSITGSLERGETNSEAALRELKEETGFEARLDELIDLDITNVFKIDPRWLQKYEPGVTHNEETCYALEVRAGVPILNAAEHTAFSWTTFEVAMRMVYWESTKKGLAAADRLRRLTDGHVRDVKKR